MSWMDEVATYSVIPRAFAFLSLICIIFLDNQISTVQQARITASSPQPLSPESHKLSLLSLSARTQLYAQSHNNL